ncbi:hypothetical protein ACFOGJ_23040 [Marinibaculum pumilum]|uniref:Uncharacterized protein n=1 Tax=Marinibaculum pumilum TaxID=1766165 RepID=A0ABV7L6C7_9PROT
MTLPRPYLTSRLLRATRVAGSACLALVVLHYVGIIGTPPPTLPQIGFYLLAGAAVGAAYGLADWLWRRRQAPHDGDAG